MRAVIQRVLEAKVEVEGKAQTLGQVRDIYLKGKG